MEGTKIMKHGHQPHPEHTGEDEGYENYEYHNFWHAWQDKRRQHLREHAHDWEKHPGHNPHQEEVQALREFFHKSTGDWPEDHWIFGGRRFIPWHQGMDTFNPFVATLLSKGLGLLPLYMLHLIARQPRYGNEIMDILAEGTNGQWVSNPGAIYPLLTLLERKGFISGQWEDPEKRTVKVYSITPEGQAELDRIRDIVIPKLEETVKVLQEFLQALGGEPAPAQGSSQGPAKSNDYYL
jgi:DNA-binding PadR family transcriptional regulator